MKFFFKFFFIQFCVTVFILSPCNSKAAPDTYYPYWDVVENGKILEIYYCDEFNCYQYGAVHTDTSYFRIVYGPNVGWGTSVVLSPSFWEIERGNETNSQSSVYYQGAELNSYRFEPVDENLEIIFSGQISDLNFDGKIVINPPGPKSITAEVAVETFDVLGNMEIDILNHQQEAFKPVFLSSMKISETSWDSNIAFVDTNNYLIPLQEGWIIPPENLSGGNFYGLRGGTSDWKRNSPTIEIELDGYFNINGWVSESSDSNDDNVAMWAATDFILDSWTYRITAKSPFYLTQSQTSQLYVSIFGRASEGEGNTYWQTNQETLVSTANVMLSTDSAKNYFGATMNDDQDFIEHIYENTLGKTIVDDPDGIAYWVADLGKGKSRGEVIVSMINAAQEPVNAGNAQDQFNNKVEVSNYVADNIFYFTGDFDQFINYIRNITHEQATVELAKDHVNAFIGLNL